MKNQKNYFFPLFFRTTHNRWHKFIKFARRKKKSKIFYCYGRTFCQMAIKIAEREKFERCIRKNGKKKFFHRNQLRYYRGCYQIYRKTRRHCFDGTFLTFNMRDFVITSKMNTDVKKTHSQRQQSLYTSQLKFYTR